MKHSLRTLSIATFTALISAPSYAETKEYKLDGFTGISTSAGVEVEVSVGGDYSVIAEGDADALERLSVEVKGTRLKISRDNAFFNIKNNRRRSPRVTVSLPDLKEAKASSGSDLHVEGVNTGPFSASASSGAELYLQGNCETLSASASTGAEFDAEELQCQHVEVRASTGGEVSVYASDSLDASASTGGEVDVSGSPETHHISKSLGGDVDID